MEQEGMLGFLLGCWGRGARRILREHWRPYLLPQRQETSGPSLVTTYLPSGAAWNRSFQCHLLSRPEVSPLPWWPRPHCPEVQAPRLRMDLGTHLPQWAEDILSRRPCPGAIRPIKPLKWVMTSSQASVSSPDKT